MEVPEPIINAINTMLAPYGEQYSPASSPVQSGGYLSLKDAASYLGMSYSTLLRQIRAGRIHPVKTGGSLNSKVIVSRVELESYVSSCR